MPRFITTRELVPQGLPLPSPFVVYRHPDGNVVPQLAPGQPWPGEPYEACVIDGTWTRATVAGAPVCWPCYRHFGAAIGAMVEARAPRLGTVAAQRMLEGGRG